MYSQVELEAYIGKKHWKRMLYFPIKEAKFHSLGNENSLKFFEQGNDMTKAILSVLVNAN